MTTYTHIPMGFRNRSHYTQKGEPKRALTAQQVRQVLADNPNLEGYVCHICQQYHTGNRPLGHTDSGGNRS